MKVSAETLFTLPDRMREAQRIFAKTGGLHAAALFTADGELVCLREDVGRHNAVDKVLGWALRAGRLPLREHVLAVSGRASFELVQKAVAGGIPVLAAVSAPSSLAVSLAAESGLTLVGFLRGRTANVYCGGGAGHRLRGASGTPRCAPANTAPAADTPPARAGRARRDPGQQPAVGGRDRVDLGVVAAGQPQHLAVRRDAAHVR